MRTVVVTRYVTPLREGGSMPAVVEADDEGTYVLKFRGAGQGTKALIAEIVAGEIARACGLLVPEIVFAELDTDLARTEPDPEIQDLIRASPGLNLALDFLPGAATFDPVADRPDAALASAVVWLDALVSNVDRTPRNPNLLMWYRRLWLIDHGAALYFHHGVSASATGDELREKYLARSREAFALIKDHVLLPLADADALKAVDARMSSALLSPGVIGGILDQIPDAWLADTIPSGSTPASEPEAIDIATQAAVKRDAYAAYLLRRLESPRPFLETAIRARRDQETGGRGAK